MVALNVLARKGLTPERSIDAFDRLNRAVSVSARVPHRQAVGTTDRVIETVASVAKFGGDAAQFGNDALGRLSKEVEHRPLLTLAVVVGVAFLWSGHPSTLISYRPRPDTKHKLRKLK
jgi:hypothetical protein